ncbi:MAG: hypothetical protein ABI423_05545 [Burkholderiales bacterium]
MKLIQDLEHRLAGAQSMFQAQLLREDIARLRKLEALAAADADAFVRDGSRLGWTQGDARTGEIREPLEAFLRALHANDEPLIAQAWDSLHRARMERLLGCLSTPVPRPAG